MESRPQFANASSQILQRIVELYGLPGLVVIGLTLALRSLWLKYTASVEARLSDAKELALAMERSTQALAALRDVIKERH